MGSEGLQDATPLPRREIDVADGPILEGQAQAEVTDHLDRRYVEKFSTRLMLGKRLNGLKLVVAPGGFPVGLELGSVQACLLGNERLRPPRQRTCDHVAVQIDRRRLPTVARAEVRPGVLCLVPIHPPPAIGGRVPDSGGSPLALAAAPAPGQ